MKLLFSLFIILSINALVAQNGYTIYYKTVYVKSDSDLYKGGEDLILAIKDSQSYTYYPTINKKYPVKYPLGSNYIPKTTYCNINKKILLSPIAYPKEPRTEALILYNFPDNEWKITNETKIILDDTCVKAVGKIWDREIIAWYSPRLPAGFGIHHYVGLPGTILETFTPEGKIMTIAVKIENTSPEIIEPTYYRRVPGETYRKKRENGGNPKIYWKEKDFISE